jgi:ADP-heptose:LPS heptosyltransferase
MSHCDMPAAPRKLILRNEQSPGDIVMLTAAVRDLHRCFPGAFLTDVRTPCPPIWENNSYVTPLTEDEREVETIHCEYPLIHRSNTAPFHFIHGFIQHLSEHLQIAITPSEFKGDIHLSEGEKNWTPQIRELAGRDIEYWVVAAGGKYDYTIKWWDAFRFQQVVDRFRGQIQFVQVGERIHHHPLLDGVIDLRGKTDMRQLIRLVYHASGVLTPTSLLMHLAAAVPTRPDRPRCRPCVVIAGGREPTHWEAYPDHQFLHTIGSLPCCETGGCWRSRTFPLGDGDENDQPDRLCVDVAGHLPRCMDLISAQQVIERIQLYLAHPARSASRNGQSCRRAVV